MKISNFLKQLEFMIKLEVYFNSIKMSKDMTKKGIGVYKISNENKNRCGEIKLNYFDKYFISGSY